MDEFNDVGGEVKEFSVDTDFNLEVDMKPDPLVPKGSYPATIADVIPTESGKEVTDSMTGAKSFRKGVVLRCQIGQVNGFRSDGETPISGAVVPTSIWFPMEDDRKQSAKDGRNKWQLMVNMLGESLKNIGAKEKAMSDVVQAIKEKRWVGYALTIDVNIETYKGRLQNTVEGFRPRSFDAADDQGADAPF